MSVLALIGIAVVTTLLAAGIAVARYRGGAAVVAGGVLAGLALSLYWLYEAFTYGTPIYETVGSLVFKIDKATAVFAFTALLIGFAASLFAVDIQPRRNQAALPPFLAAFIFTVVLLGLSADVLTACVMVELQTLAIILTLLAGEEFASEAAVKYMYMALLGSAVIAAGLGLLGLPEAALVTVGLALFAVGLLLKAGIFPFHAWLPDVHARAHTSASAVLSSVAVASGLVAFMNILPKYIEQVLASKLCSALGNALLALAIASMIYGSLCAISQPDIKRALAYSTIGHMGFALAPLGVGLVLVGSGEAPVSYLSMYMAVSMLYIVVHALGKALLFLAGGLPVGLYGIHEYTHLGGLFRKHKVATWTFLGGALTLSGLPPLPGFLAKLLVILVLTDLALRVGSPWYVAALCLTVGVAIATPVYTIRRLWHRTFLGEPREAEYPPTPHTFLANTACLLLFLALLILGTVVAFMTLGAPAASQILLPPVSSS